MTKEEIQVQYQNIATKAGDILFKVEEAREVVRALEARLDALRAEKRALQTKLNEVSDVAAVDVPKTDS